MVTYIDGQKASGSFDKASQINMNDGRTVEDAIKGLLKNGTSNIIDVPTSYEFPCDGYLTYGSDDVMSGTLGITLKSSNNKNIGYLYINTTSKPNWNTIFVKKGMKIAINTKPTTASVIFSPLDI